MNSSAAFNFLREMEERKMQEYEKDEGSDAQKIVFKNSKKLAFDEISEPAEKRIRGNKFLMPEYVVGEKKTKQNKTIGHKSSSTKSSKQLKLTHLEEEEEAE